MSLCCGGGIPSFSSTRSLIRSTLSVGSISISISLPNTRISRYQSLFPCLTDQYFTKRKASNSNLLTELLPWTDLPTLSIPFIIIETFQNATIKQCVTSSRSLTMNFVNDSLDTNFLIKYCVFFLIMAYRLGFSPWSASCSKNETFYRNKISEKYNMFTQESKIKPCVYKKQCF